MSCTTHHGACDCREEAISHLCVAASQLVDATPGQRLDATARVIVALNRLGYSSGKESDANEETPLATHTVGGSPSADVPGTHPPPASIPGVCSCGGNGPGDGCPACEVWHWLVTKRRGNEATCAVAGAVAVERAMGASCESCGGAGCRGDGGGPCESCAGAGYRS